MMSKGWRESGDDTTEIVTRSRTPGSLRFESYFF